MTIEQFVITMHSVSEIKSEKPKQGKVMSAEKLKARMEALGM